MIDNPNSNTDGIASHDDPILSESPIDHVPVYTLQSEDGFFPTGYSEEILTSHNNAQLYQMNPKTAHEHDQKQKNTKDEKIAELFSESTILAEGTFTLRDPARGTPSEVALIGECDGTLFYVKQNDAIIKMSSKTFAIIFPEDCITIHFLQENDEERAKEEDSMLLYMEALFAARTKFINNFEQTPEIASDSNDDNGEDDDIKNFLDNKTSKHIYSFSKYVGKKINAAGVVGASYISNYGESKRNGVLVKKEASSAKSVNNSADSNSNLFVRPSTIYAAGALQKAGKFTNTAVKTVGNNVSNTIGKSMAGTFTAKENDSESTQRNKKVALSSALVLYSLADSTTAAYRLMAKAAKEETVEYMNVKYGKDASELARKTLGASIEFGEAALSARRFLNVKHIIKASAKVALKESVKKQS